jgi:hypothetical protein
MTKAEAKAFINAAVKLRGLATDEQALEVQSLYPSWKEAVAYVLGDRVIYNDVLYKVITAHTSQVDWAPDVATSLFAKVLIPDTEVVYSWEQPDSTNPYMTGDKVSYNGKTWISSVDNNVWEPGVYGWNEITE